MSEITKVHQFSNDTKYKDENIQTKDVDVVSIVELIIIKLN